jgi:hypothetical protein
MELNFTRDSPLNTSLVNSDGQALYKITSPFKFPTRTTTISKVVPCWKMYDYDNGKDSKKDDSGGEDLMDKFLLVAQIDWKSMGSNKLRFGGIEHDANTFLAKRGALLQ